MEANTRRFAKVYKETFMEAIGQNNTDNEPVAEGIKL
jgi:hypothetical protein